MKLTFPHIGNAYIPLRTLLEGMGLEVVVAPRPTPKTLVLGASHSPEFACFPLKLCLGNYMEAYEMGADTIMMAGGVGPCRFGYYAQVQKGILDQLGYDFDMIVLEPPKGHLGELVSTLRRLKGRPVPVKSRLGAARLAWEKMVCLENMEEMARKARCRRDLPRVERVYRQGIEDVDKAGSLAGIRGILPAFCEQLEGIPLTEITDPLKVGIVGEIYMIMEPFANLRLEEKLGSLGVEVHRQLTVTGWATQNILLDFLRVKKGERLKEAARPYLGHFVGGEGLESVGQTVVYGKNGVDGVIQVMPFGCMPEIVAQTVLPGVTRDLGIPVLHLIFDEHSGEAGLMTRLEAFVDLLERKRLKEGSR